KAVLAATLRRPADLARQLADMAGQIALESVRRHRAFIVIVLGYWLACHAAAWAAGGAAAVDIRPLPALFSILVLMLTVPAVVGTVFYVMIVERPAGSLYPAIGHALFGRLLSADRLANLFIPLAVGPLFFTTFGSFKRLIPLVNPYGWDHSFMLWDAWLHGGL